MLKTEILQVVFEEDKVFIDPNESETLLAIAQRAPVVKQFLKPWDLKKHPR